MSYNSVFTVITDAARAEDALAPVVAFTQAQDAHVDVLALGVDHSQTGYYYAGANAMVLQETVRKAHSSAEAAEKAIEESLIHSGLRFGVSTAIAQLSDIGRPVADQSQFTDISVLLQPYGDAAKPEDESVLEAILFEGRTPVLVCPEGHQIPEAFEKVIVAWNGSKEAMTAVRAAMPLLVAAQSVRIVIIDPPQHGTHRSDPGGLLALLLSRHGVNCEIDILSKTLPRVSDVLMRHAADIDADLIVMGAYGHSRLREAILGGATRNTLEGAKVPVLMAH